MSYAKYLKVEDCKTGKGVFTSVAIPANSMVLEMSGTIVTEVPPNDHDMFLQIGPNTFIGPSGGTDDYVNHSCNPNCKMHIVGDRAFLYSLYVIPTGAELTFDYATTSTETLDSWQMNCKCGSYNCRKVISGYKYIDQKTFEDYLKKGAIPMYITAPQLFQNR